MITQDHTIVDGYARWELARLQGLLTLPCMEYQLTEEEALHWLLQKHRRSNGFNDFSRILLALELETWFREKARSNQRAGGQKKGLSKLTEAERLDVRAEIAAAAGVSVGNVSKVRQLTISAHLELLQALRSGQIRIHRAWLWSELSREEQVKALRLYRSKRGIKKTVRDLLSRHRPKRLPMEPDLSSLVRRLSALESSELAQVSVAVISAPGKTVFVTEELFQSLRPHQESIPTCSTNRR